MEQTENIKQLKAEEREIDLTNNIFKSKSNLQLLKLSHDLTNKHEKLKETILKKVEELEAIEDDYKQIMDVLLYRKQ